MILWLVVSIYIQVVCILRHIYFTYIGILGLYWKDIQSTTIQVYISLNYCYEGTAVSQLTLYISLDVSGPERHSYTLLLPPQRLTVYLYNEPEKMTQASHDFRFAHSSLFLQFSSISRPQLPLWGDCYGGISRCLHHFQSGEGNYIIKMYDWLWSPVCIYCSVCIKCKHIFIWVEISGTMSRYRLYSELTETNSLPTRYTL